MINTSTQNFEKFHKTLIDSSKDIKNVLVILKQDPDEDDIEKCISILEKTIVKIRNGSQISRT
jgi:hypothetical protein